MTRRIEWTKRALKEIARLDVPTRKRILEALRKLSEESPGDVRRLQGVTDPVHRLRVGNWRILFEYQEDLTILVLRIRPRGDAYKG